MELKELCSTLFDEFEQDRTPYPREALEEYFNNVTTITTSDNVEVDFRLCMGAKPETANSLFWWTDCRVIHIGLIKNIDVMIGNGMCHINFIETGVRGWFFVFFETLKRICKAHGIKQITLCNRGPIGFWAAQGFEGPDGHMTYKV